MSAPLEGTPEETYRRTRADVDTLLNFLRADLESHAAMASVDLSSTALVDHLAAVRSRLVGIVATLQRLPESTIDMMVRQAGEVNKPRQGA